MIKYRMMIFLAALFQLCNLIATDSFTPLPSLDCAIEEARCIPDEVKRAEVESILVSIREQVASALLADDQKAALDACQFLNAIIEDITNGCEAKLRHYVIIHVQATIESQ